MFIPKFAQALTKCILQKNIENKMVKLLLKNPPVSILLMYINVCNLTISKQKLQNLEVSKIFKRYYMNNGQINQR